MSFSADTGMAECLVIARKRKPEVAYSHRSSFISLMQRPQGFALASVEANLLSREDSVRRIEDGPYGGTPFTIGTELAGHMMTTPGKSHGGLWESVRLMDFSLAQTAFALCNSILWLPASPDGVRLEFVLLDAIANLGFHHLDITGLPSKGPPQGPFSKVSPSPTATYPSLWNHDAKRETRMICAPDSQLQVRTGMENKAAIVWATASRSHLNLDFRFNSQPLAVAFTDRETVGGRAWPNIKFDNIAFDHIFTIWSNSTLGLLCFGGTLTGKLQVVEQLLR